MRRRLDLAAALVHGPTRPLPGRADHRPRPGQPQDDLGGGAGTQRRGHDRLPHHPVPGGGRPARRQRRHHRERHDRRRGHARGAEGEVGHPHVQPAARPGLNRRGGGGLRSDRQTAAARDGKTVLVEVESGTSEIGPRGGALDQAGLEVESLDLVQPTLDDVFVAKDRPPPREGDEEDDETEAVEA